MKKFLRELFSAPILLTALLIGSVIPTQAAVYTGSWDPAYGSPFTTTGGFAFDLGWRGKGFFDVPDVCAPGAGGFQIVNSASCGATTLSAYVQFYDLANPVPTLEQLDWGGSSVNNVGALSGLLYNNGQLIGFNTSAFDYVDDLDQYVAPNGLGPLAWSLAFSFETESPPGTNGPTLAWQDNCRVGVPCSGTNDPNIPIDFVVTAVPEPGSLYLVAAALAGVGWASRRRRS
ncbi:MAG: PEP-CTERM sorting domain-containing protein [Pseudomonadota bacterium]|nr:PEP-CTERM sorting domain-containing protein [Pseudomonadota bacterium]